MSLATIDSIADAVAFFRERAVLLHTTHTDGPALMTETIGFQPLVAKSLHARTSKEISVISAELIESCMRRAAPQAHQTLAISDKFLATVYAFMTRVNESITTLKNQYDSFLPPQSKITDAAQLLVYREACAQFRLAIGRYQDAFPTQTNPVVTEIDPGVYANDLRFILECMMHKRDLIVGGTTTGGNKHVVQLERAFRDEGLPQLPFSPMKRRRGAELRGGFDGAVWNEDLNPLLLTTAILSQLQGVERNSSILNKINELMAGPLAAPGLQDYATELKAAFLIAIEESAHDYNIGNVDGGGFFSQIANADVLFNTYFFLFVVCGLTIQNFKDLQPTIYLICSKLRSNTVLNRMIEEFRTRPCMRVISVKLSKSTHVHLPPWVMTPKRLYDIASIVCPFSLKNIDGSIVSPAISVRYISNYNSLDNYFFSFITAMHGMEARACELDGTSILNCIAQSEYILHQALIGRRHGFANTQRIAGNALNVRIV